MIIYQNSYMQTNAHTKVQMARKEHKIRPGFCVVHPGYHSLLSRTCGFHCVNRVISGTEAVFLEWRWLLYALAG